MTITGGDTNGAVLEIDGEAVDIDSRILWGVLRGVGAQQRGETRTTGNALTGGVYYTRDWALTPDQVARARAVGAAFDAWHDGHRANGAWVQALDAVEAVAASGEVTPERIGQELDRRLQGGDLWPGAVAS